MLRQKISIVTPKPQTTRHRIVGILTEDTYQVVFLDTPGLIKPKYLLQEHMMKFVGSAIDDADILLYLVDVTKRHHDPLDIYATFLEEVERANKTLLIVLNKIDRMNKEDLLPIIDDYGKLSVSREIIPASALTGENLDDVIQTVVRYLPEHPAFYNAETLTEQSERFFVAEIIREKAFERLREEVPYAVTVDILEFKERGEENTHTGEGVRGKSKAKDFISAEIFVEKDSQKGIVIGRGGKMLKEIGERSRKDIEEFLGRPVFLELHVKVRPNWRDDEKWLKRLGY